MRPDLEGSVRRPRFQHQSVSLNVEQSHTMPMNGGYRGPNSGRKDEFDDFEGELVDKNNIHGVARSEID